MSDTREQQRRDKAGSRLKRVISRVPFDRGGDRCDRCQRLLPKRNCTPKHVKPLKIACPSAPLYGVCLPLVNTCNVCAKRVHTHTHTHGREGVVFKTVERDVGLKRVSTIINGEEWNPGRYVTPVDR